MIHAKITPILQSNGSIRILVEWVDVETVEGVGPRPGEVKCVEEFQSSGLKGAAYVSRVGFQEGEAGPNTFWLDAKGARHFVVEAEPGYVGLIGSPVEV